MYTVRDLKISHFLLPVVPIFKIRFRGWFRFSSFDFEFRFRVLVDSNFKTKITGSHFVPTCPVFVCPAVPQITVPSHSAKNNFAVPVPSLLHPWFFGIFRGLGHATFWLAEGKCFFICFENMDKNKELFLFTASKIGLNGTPYRSVLWICRIFWCRAVTAATENFWYRTVPRHTERHQIHNTATGAQTKMVYLPFSLTVLLFRHLVSSLNSAYMLAKS